jgi:hypothetical protein
LIDQVSALAKEVLEKDKAIELIIKTAEGEKDGKKEAKGKTEDNEPKKDAA